MNGALYWILILNAKCTQKRSSLLATLNKTQENTNKLKRSTRGKEDMGVKENTFLAKDRTKKNKGQSEHDQ